MQPRRTTTLRRTFLAGRWSTKTAPSVVQATTAGKPKKTEESSRAKTWTAASAARQRASTKLWRRAPMKIVRATPLSTIAMRRGRDADTAATPHATVSAHHGAVAAAVVTTMAAIATNTKSTTRTPVGAAPAMAARIPDAAPITHASERWRPRKRS
jgi:hypothetical protein